MIKWSGIKISVHPFFVIIMLASVLTGHFLELIALFAIVFIHELGHVFAARCFDVNVLSIQMLPFGGVAEMEDTSHLTVRREIAIALAGPLQNVILIGISLLLKVCGLWEGAFFIYFIHSNLLIALFNLLPILPLDGGKVWQSLCSTILPFHLTLVYSLRISLLFSVLVILYAVVPYMFGQGMPNLNLLLVGIFLFYSNWMDYRNIMYRFMRFLVNREQVYVRHWMNGGLAQPIVTNKSQPLEQILRLFRRQKYHFVYVMNQQGDIVAVLPEQRIISSFLRGKPGA
ncbi:M50 family metallopeptidase [Paenibacillus aceti]|uniref:Stage IV sporulation protein FB n=1 Tax=Paenibacillus aceti TaxID=1820010 RepID=A0ABQ1VQ04_9BACL|nr:M50 family metallopeptidase [Paenibacillus aceti]GGF88544.1 stage IV sporulation protein FB [Paenibacillus aceti]